MSALIFVIGVALVAVSLFYATHESDEFGRLPFLIIGGISAAAGVALAGLGILIMRRGRSAGLPALLVLGLVALGVVLFSVSGLLPFAVIPVAAALLVVARAFLASGFRRRTA